MPALDPLPYILGDKVIEGPVDGLDEQVGLRVKVPEHQRLGHASTGGDLPGAHLFVAVRIEQLPSRAQDQRADSRRAASGAGVRGHSTMMTDQRPRAGLAVRQVDRQAGGAVSGGRENVSNRSL